MIMCIAGLLLFSAVVSAQNAQQTPRRPVLIIDTDIAEGRVPEPGQPKEPDLAKSRASLDIGNTYFNRRNYPAAISRYLEAIAWQENSIPAHEALARAYERNGDIDKAIETLEAVIEKNPGARQNRGFQTRIDNLRKRLR
jgi:FimV-like protein